MQPRYTAPGTQADETRCARAPGAPGAHVVQLRLRERGQLRGGAGVGLEHVDVHERGQPGRQPRAVGEPGRDVGLPKQAACGARVQPEPCRGPGGRRWTPGWRIAELCECACAAACAAGGARIERIACGHMWTPPVRPQGRDYAGVAPRVRWPGCCTYASTSVVKCCASACAEKLPGAASACSMNAPSATLS